jgi:ribosome-binding protein aMBF1 (putative translation factor)
MRKAVSPSRSAAPDAGQNEPFEMKERNNKLRTIKEDVRERMKDPAFKKAWRDLDAEFELLESIIKARETAGLAQEELARRIGTNNRRCQGLRGADFRKQTLKH